MRTTDIAQPVLAMAFVNMQPLDYVYDEAQANEETMFLYRYRVTDYQVKEATCFEYSSGRWVEQDTNSYFFKEEVDLFFDVIDVTCRKDGVDTVLSVVMDPLEFIPAVTPPTDTETDNPMFGEDLFENPDDFWKDWFYDEEGGLSMLSWILIGIGAYLLLCVLGKIGYPLIPFILCAPFGVLWLITLPFKAVAFLINKIRGDDK